MSASDFGGGLSGTGLSKQQSRLEHACLYHLSMKAFKDWLEEDEDVSTKKHRENTQEKMRDAKQSHEQFVKMKDRSVRAYVCVYLPVYACM